MASLRACCSLLILAGLSQAQTPAAPPDTLVFADGEKLIGHFVRSNGSTITFKSDILGEVNVDRSKIQELRTSEKIVVIGKNVKLGRRRSDLTELPQGTATITTETVTVATEAGAPTTLPADSAAHIVDRNTFQKVVMHNPGFLEDWKGAVSAGVAIVEATQQSRTYTASVNLIRAIPSENWLDARNRTIVDFNVASGILNQPNTPQIKTSIVHADVERDEYFRGKDVYGFVQGAFDHNYSQGLDLEQTYGGGIGWTVLKHANTTLDVKGGVTYMRQSFQVASNDHNLVGSVFGETFTHKFPRGILFLQGISVMPSWNEGHAWTANGNAALSVPVYKNLSYTTSVLDSFLNDPPPGFKKNSFQFTNGLTYSFK